MVNVSILIFILDYLSMELNILLEPKVDLLTLLALKSGPREPHPCLSIGRQALGGIINGGDISPQPKQTNKHPKLV